MRVTVRFYARLRDLTGSRQHACEVPDGGTVRDVWRACVQAYPAIAVLDGSVSCAVNDDFSAMDAPINDGDEVAFLPPVSGGNGTEP